jgi:hypothetical protein
MNFTDEAQRLSASKISAPNVSFFPSVSSSANSSFEHVNHCLCSRQNG